MSEKERKFKVFEIDEEEPDFSDIEKEDLTSFAVEIKEELEDEGWLQEEQFTPPELSAEEALIPTKPILPREETSPVTEKEKQTEPELSQEKKEESPETAPEASKNTFPEEKKTFSGVSDKLAVVMGLVSAEPVYQKPEPASSLDAEPEFASDSEIEITETAAEDPGEPSVPNSAADGRPKPQLPVQEGDIPAESVPDQKKVSEEDEFFRCFGDFRFEKSGMPKEALYTLREEDAPEEQTVYRKTQPNKGLSALKTILSWVLTMVVAFVMAMVINIYLFRPSEVSGPSMMPTLHNGDTVILSRIPYMLGKPQRGDIVVIDSHVDRKRNTLTLFAEALEYNVVTKLCGHSEPDYFWIKRVIGIPGDTISFESNRIYRNGEALQETYINEQDVYTYKNGTSLTVEEGYVFVMGDNRNHSTDSRVIGPVPVENIIGKMIANW